MTNRTDYANQLEDQYLLKAPEYNQELIAQALSIYVSNKKMDKDTIRIMVGKLWYPCVAGGHRQVAKDYEAFVAKYKNWKRWNSDEKNWILKLFKGFPIIII